MESSFWWIWIILAAIFIIGEIFTTGFFLLWFGMGAGVAALLCWLGVSSVWQWGAFGATSLVLFFLSRPFAERISKKQPPGIGADRFVDKDGVVVADVSVIDNTGMVRVEREEWRAITDTGSVIVIYQPL